MKIKDVDRLKRITLDSLVVYDKQITANTAKAYVVFLGFLINKEIKSLKLLIKSYVQFCYKGKMIGFVIDEDLLHGESYYFSASTIDQEKDIIIRFILGDHNKFKVQVYDLSTMILGFSATILITNEKKRP